MTTQKILSILAVLSAILTVVLISVKIFVALNTTPPATSDSAVPLKKTYTLSLSQEVVVSEKK